MKNSHVYAPSGFEAWAPCLEDTKREFDLPQALGQKPLLLLGTFLRHANAMTYSNRIKAILVAATLCAAFMAVGWATRFPYTFPDLQNYRTGFESGWYMFSVINLDWPRFIIAEGAWVYGFDALWRFVGNIDSSFFVVSTFATFLIVYYIFARTKSYAAIIFILNPAFVNLVIEQLRSGLAASIFYIATLVRRPYIQAPLFLVALSIHTSFILFVAFYYAYIIGNRIGFGRFFEKHFLIGTATLFALAFVISYFRDFALSSLGDTRAFTQEDQTSGILLAIGWLLFLVSFYFLWPREENSFDLHFFSLNIFMFISSILTGVYGSRFVAIGIPALAVMSGHINKERRPLFYLHYFLFSALYFAVWVSV